MWFIVLLKPFKCLFLLLVNYINRCDDVCVVEYSLLECNYFKENIWGSYTANNFKTTVVHFVSSNIVIFTNVVIWQALA